MSTNAPDPANDPYLWLEDIDGQRVSAWVDAENTRTEAALRDARYQADFEAALAILNSEEKLPFVAKHGDWLYNFWKDGAHPRGLWRRTTLESYRSAQPEWDVLLDMDALCAAEGVTWEFHGAVRSPDKTRALVSLSFNGTDAVEIREFEIAAKRFVDGGFLIPKAKGSAAWLDRDTLLLNSPLEEAQATEAGYGRTVRRWPRGTPLADAATVFEVEKQAVGAWFGINHRPGSERTMFWRAIDFTRSEVFIEPKGGQRLRLDLPEKAGTSLNRRHLYVSPKEDWTVGGKTIAAGALATIALDAFIAGSRNFDVIFTPTPRIALQNWVETRHGVLLQLLDNVRSRVVLAKRADTGWTTRNIEGVPSHASIYVEPFGGQDDPDLGTDVLFTATTYVTPTTLALWNDGGAPAVLKTAPQTFDAAGIEVEQRHARADDGESIPYFLIGKNLSAGGAPRPTLLYGYGGFEVSLTPGYMNLAGKLWLAHGYRYAVANIRGGGEFGPRWHEAAIKQTKPVAHDDFAAVAKHLISSGMTTPKQLACQGGSNGGLLVGNMLARYPELFGAIWCAVPLLDMARYTKLLAGQSWIAEYGDPDDPTQWEFVRRFSPYHLIEPGRHYPPIFLTTNRTDDRVHPGHARKMAARLEALGAEVFFHENVAGGHGGIVDNTRTAMTQALGFAFLRRTIAAADRAK
jgi:prolyl oligopeptidase